MLKRFWNYCKALRSEAMDRSKYPTVTLEQLEQAQREMFAQNPKLLEELKQHQDRVWQKTADALSIKAEYQKTLSVSTYHISDAMIIQVILWMAAIISLIVLITYY